MVKTEDNWNKTAQPERRDYFEIFEKINAKHNFNISDPQTTIDIVLIYELFPNFSGLFFS